MKRIFIENDLIVKIVTVALAITITIVIMIVASKAEGSSTPIVGLTEEQLKELRALPRGDTSVDALNKEHNRPPDVEVKWITSPLASQLYNVVSGIFIEDNGTTVRVVDCHPKYVRGARVWLSQDSGKTWRVEKYLRDVWSDKTALLGPEKAKVLFSVPETKDWEYWPTETESLIRKRYIGRFKHDSEHSYREIRFARDGKRLFFATVRATGADKPPDHTTRLFVSLDNSENWLELSRSYRRVTSIGIQEISGNKLLLLTGAQTGGPKLEYAILDVEELENYLISDSERAEK